MAKQTINIGTTANDGTGDPLRTAFDKVNSNFTELYNDDTGDVNSIIAGDGISVDTATGNVTVTNTITNNNQLINGAGYVDGTGTANYITKWTDGDTIANSVIYDNGTNVGIGTGVPTEKIQVVGNGLFTGNVGLGAAPLTAIGNKRLTIYETNSTSLVLSNSNNFVNIFNGSTVGDPTSIFSNTGFKFAIASDASATGFSEKMRIASTGNVGIGTSSPSAKTDIQANSTSIVPIQVINTNNNFDTNPTVSETVLRIAREGKSGVSFRSAADFGISRYENVGSNARTQLDIRLNNAQGAIPDNLIMSLRANGNVGIGTSSPATELHIASSSPILTLQDTDSTEPLQTYIQFTDSASNVHAYIGMGSGTTDDFKIVNYYDVISFYTGTGGTTAERMRLQTNGDLHVDGDVIAYSTTISDQRLKDDVQTIDNALDKVSNLRGVSYTWNNGNRKGQKDLGLIAQEVEQVLPELVREKEMPMIDGGTYKTVDYEKIVGVLIEAVKELTEKVNKLEAK